MAHTISTPPNESRADASGRWPVLARLPDLTAEARPAPQRPPHTTAPARPSGRRFDAPRPRAVVVAPPDRAEEIPSEVGKHAAHMPQPPAHHLNRRVTRLRPTDDRVPAESAVLPAWDPFSIPGKKLSEAFAPIFSFLVMVALFTAAGTSILLLRSGHRQVLSDSPHAAVQVEQNTAASTTPSAVGPLGVTGSRLVPTPNVEPLTAAIPTPPTPSLSPSIHDDATGNNVTGIDVTPSSAGPAATNELPTTEYPEPVFPETSDAKLPQAEATKTPLPIARFSGQILEAETRQAKNEDESIIH